MLFFYSTNSCYMFAYLILKLVIIFTLFDDAYYKLLNSSLCNIFSGYYYFHPLRSGYSPQHLFLNTLSLC
jgi:hypothetical protein